MAVLYTSQTLFAKLSDEIISTTANEKNAEEVLLAANRRVVIARWQGGFWWRYMRHLTVFEMLASA